MRLFETDPNDGVGRLWFKLIVSSSLAAFMAFCIFHGIGHCRIQWSSRHWPKTEMIITSAEEFSNRSIQFEYEFEVNGRKHTANTKTTETPITPNQIRSLKRKYRVGTIHDLFYDPENPNAYSVLKPGGNFAMQFLVIVLATISLFRITSNIRNFCTALILHRRNVKTAPVSKTNVP